MSQLSMLGGIAFILMAVMLLLLITLWPLGPHTSFSRHAAQSKQLSVYYFLIFGITLPLFWVYVTFYLIPKFDMPQYIYMLFGMMCLLQIACTLFPDKSSTVRVHRTLAGLSAALLLPILVIMMLYIETTVLRSFGWLSVFIMSATALYVGVNKQHNILIAQIVYYLAFFVPVCLLGLLK